MTAENNIVELDRDEWKIYSGTIGAAGPDSIIFGVKLDPLNISNNPGILIIPGGVPRLQRLA